MLWVDGPDLEGGVPANNDLAILGYLCNFGVAVGDGLVMDCLLRGSHLR